MSLRTSLTAGRQVKRFVRLTTLAAGAWIAGLSAATLPQVHDIQLDRNTVPRFERLEVTLGLDGEWTNSFDPDDVRVSAEITTPTRTVTVDAFAYQDYRLEGDRLVPHGEQVWKIRFTPTETGSYALRITARTRAGAAAAGPFAFICTPGNGRGFVGVSRTNPHYFAYTDGTTFFPIGHNLIFPWRLPLGAATAENDRLLGELARHGGNFVRSWWCVPDHNLERRIAPGEPPRGPGWMDLASAWNIDRTVDRAAELGIHLMCCLENQGNFLGRHYWSQSPYNRANGGPLAHPEDFFTHREAARFFRMRLRYLVARWGYSPTIFSWQFYNEVNSSPNFQPGPVARWHAEMAGYLRSIDPNPHLIHANLSRLNGVREINELPEMDLVSTNVYYHRDAALTADWTQQFAQRLNKPFLLTEYGAAHYDDKRDCDPTGVLLNNTLWGQTVGGGAGAGLAWWWDTWIDAHDLHYQYRILADFVSGVDFAAREWFPVKVAAFGYTDADERPAYGSSFIEQWRRNFEPQATNGDTAPVVTVKADGSFDQRDVLMGQVFNPQKLPVWLARNPGSTVAYGTKSFDAEWPVDGFVDLIVPEIDSTKTPVLRVLVDGSEVLKHGLSVTEHTADDPGDDFYRRFRFPVKPGHHRLILENPGDGFYSFALRLGRHRLVRGPDLQVRGMRSDRQILLWLRHPEYNWLYDRVGLRPTRQRAGRLTLDQVPAGTFHARWIDTLSGAALHEETVSSKDGRLVLATPAIHASAAARIDRLP